MSAIRFFGAGKSRLPKGAPLRLLLLLESKLAADDSGETAGSEPAFSVALTSSDDNSSGESTFEIPLGHRDTVRAGNGIIVDVFTAEVDTSSLRSGAYDVRLEQTNPNAANNTAELDEVVLILETRDYEDLIREEVEQTGIDTENLFRIESTLPYQGSALESLVQQIFAERLEGIFRIGDTFMDPPKIQITYEAEVAGTPVQADPLAYMVSVLASQCRDLILFGVSNLGIRLHVYSEKYLLSVNATLIEQLSSLTTANYSDAHRSELLITSKILNESFTVSDTTATVDFFGSLVTLSFGASAVRHLRAGGAGGR